MIYVAMSVDEIREKLQLEKLKPGNWNIQSSCATTGDGLVEGFNWLALNIR